MANNALHIRPNFLTDVIPTLDAAFKSEAYCRDVHTATWQGRDISSQKAGSMKELLNVSLDLDVCNTNRDVWIDAFNPNLPWADAHFEERVCGAPINPGVEWANWPWGNSASKFLDHQGDRFNHNYMERYWPVYAGVLDAPTQTPLDWSEGISELDITPPNRGIRNTYGDLNDVVNLLVSDPLTRQAYLPLFFPEDTGQVEGGRRPCSLGYQFIVRDSRLHCYYPMRSCDFVRHFGDDVYLTLRLMKWVLEKCQAQERTWRQVRLGSLQMHMTSLHMFINDWHARYSA